MFLLLVLQDDGRRTHDGTWVVERKGRALPVSGQRRDILLSFLTRNEKRLP